MIWYTRGIMACGVSVNCEQRTHWRDQVAWKIWTRVRVFIMKNVYGTRSRKSLQPFTSLSVQRLDDFWVKRRCNFAEQCTNEKASRSFCAFKRLHKIKWSSIKIQSTFHQFFFYDAQSTIRRSNRSWQDDLLLFHRLRFACVEKRNVREELLTNL
jgi:hypothetical protein